MCGTPDRQRGSADPGNTEVVPPSVGSRAPNIQICTVPVMIALEPMAAQIGGYSASALESSLTEGAR